MAETYNYALHKEYERKINNDVNIKDKIFESLNLYLSVYDDTTTYPEDQVSLYELAFPNAYLHSMPIPVTSDYILSFKNYKETGNLFTVRYLDPHDSFCEVMFLNPNDERKLWIFFFTSKLEDIELIRCYDNDDLDNAIQYV
jgi:hypothetical protein